MLDGTAALSGFDPLDLPFDRFLNWVHQWFRERLPARDFRSFDMKITRPLPGEDPTDGPWSDEDMGAAFMSAQAEIGGGG